MAGISRMDVLVTGGAGFIGSHLCDRLMARGHRVLCVDNLLTGRVESIRPLLNHPRFEFIEHDIIHRSKSQVRCIAFTTWLVRPRPHTISSTRLQR